MHIASYPVPQIISKYSYRSEDMRIYKKMNNPCHKPVKQPGQLR